MSVKAKYIKDLPLKNVLDGSESLLVQDSNGTKQAPLEVIVDEIKQNSQEKIREIESELSEKANKADLTNSMTPKGTCNYADLPTDGNEVGWYYYCNDGDSIHGSGNYMWNGENWFFSGTGDEGYTKLNDFLKKSRTISDIDFSIAFNGYVNSKGVLVSESTYIITNKITLKKGQKIYVTAKGYSSSVAIISKVVEGSYIPLVTSIDSSVKVFTYSAEEQMEIVISTKDIPEKYAYIVTDVLAPMIALDAMREDVILKNVNKEIDLSDSEAGCYVNSKGKYVVHSTFSISKPFYVPKGATITFNGRGSSNQVSMISKVVEGGYVPLVISVDSTDRTYTYITEESMDVALSYKTSEHHSCSYEYENNLDLIRQEVENNRDEIDNLKGEIKKETTEIPYLYLFHKMAGVGDSLMSGEHVPDSEMGNAKDVYTFSWLSNLARDARATCVHYSRGGMTAKGWISDSNGYRTELESENEKSSVYFIALGTNDKNQSYPIGNIEDTDDNDTFAGYYKKIIEIIHNHNEHAIIFCVSMYDNNPISQPYSKMVNDISNLYDYCFFVDLIANGAKSTKETGLYTHNSHYTSLGYLEVSQTIKKIVEKTVSDNLESFKWFGLNND